MSVYYNEMDPYAAQWLRNLILEGHLPRGDVDERSITDVRPDDLRGYTQCHFFAGIGGWPLAARLAGLPDDYPIWTGSCPCQPFSQGGKRKGFDDERHLWPHFRSLIAECKPPTVFGEQVARGGGKKWLALVASEFEEMGFAFGAADLCSSTFGAGQERERLFFVAYALGPTATGGRPALRRGRRPQEVDTHWRNAGWRESCEVGVLDDGLPSKLAKAITKGFGNAIVPEVGASFIETFMEWAA